MQDETEEARKTRRAAARQGLREALVGLTEAEGARHDAATQTGGGSMAAKEISAVLIEAVEWVKGAQENLVAFEAVANSTKQVFALDGTQALKLAEGLMAHLPPEPGEPLDIQMSVGPGEHTVTDMSVVLPQSPSRAGEAERYQMHLKIGDQAVTLTMRHQELARWIFRMQRDIQNHRRRHAN